MLVSAQTIPEPVMQAGNAEFVRQVQETIFVQVTRPIETLGVIWSLGLWTVLVRRARSVKLRQALLAVLPVALFELAKMILLF